MKKVLLALAAAAGLMLTAQTASAQFFIGGSLGITTTTMRDTEDGTTQSGFSFKISPEAGYMFTDRMGAGGTITFQSGFPYIGSFDANDLKGLITAGLGVESDLGNTNRQSRSRVLGFNFAPYFRYVLIDTRRFSLFADAVLGYGSYTMQSQTGDGGWRDASKVGLLQVLARPGFSMKLDPHFSVVGHIGSLGLQSMSSNGENMTRFGIDLDSYNLSLGVIYIL